MSWNLSEKADLLRSLPCVTDFSVSRAAPSNTRRQPVFSSANQHLRQQRPADKLFCRECWRRECIAVRKESTCFGPQPKVLELSSLRKVHGLWTCKAAMPFMKGSCFGMGVLVPRKVDDCRTSPNLTACS